MKTKSLLIGLAGLVMIIWIGTVLFTTPFDAGMLLLTIGFRVIMFGVLIFAQRQTRGQ